jgi:transposase
MFSSADVLYKACGNEYATTVQLRYSYRLYPTPGQCAALTRAFGCARVAFNDGLRTRQEAFAAGLPYITDGELSARLTAAKATPERAWRCRRCGVWLDRDVNAAVNVARAAGLAVSACGAQVRPGLALAQRGEAGTLRGAA